MIVHLHSNFYRKYGQLKWPLCTACGRMRAIQYIDTLHTFHKTYSQDLCLPIYFISHIAPSCLYLLKMSHLTFLIMHQETGDNGLLTQREPHFQGFHEQQLLSLQLNVNLLRDLSFSGSDHLCSPKQNQRPSKSVLVLMCLRLFSSLVHEQGLTGQNTLSDPVICNLPWQSFPSTVYHCGRKLGWS